MVFDKDKLKKIIDEHKATDQEGLQTLLRDLTKEVIEARFDWELTDHLGYEKHQQDGSTELNPRNGWGKKLVQSKLGEVELSPPRDLSGTFYPQVVKKWQLDISGIEEKVIINMHAKGMSTRDIISHIDEIYG